MIPGVGTLPRAPRINSWAIPAAASADRGSRSRLPTAAPLPPGHDRHRAPIHSMASQAAAGSGSWPVVPQGKRDSVMEDLFNAFTKTEEESSSMSIHKPFDFTMRDTSQKVVRLKNNSLVAEASNHNPEKLSVVPNQFLTGKQYPIILGVQEGKRCLSCNPSAQPTLQLEEKEIMALVEDKEQATRFTFHNMPAGSTHRFESAANPGWFLCTSQKNSEPLSVTNQLGAAQITDFYFQRLQT